jgi:hypothetical protein
MSPEYFIIPIIMGQASSIIDAIKTGIIIFDCAMLMFFLFVFYSTDMEMLKGLYYKWTDNKKNSIIISTQIKHRSVKFRAIMHFLAKKNETIYCLREDTYFDWDNNEKRSEYLVDQLQEFKLTNAIMGSIHMVKKEKNARGTQQSEMIEYNTLTIFSYVLPLSDLQLWVETQVKNYKEHLRHTSNEKQLFITAYTTKGSGGGSSSKSENSGENGNSIKIESIPWESSATMENSYFQNMDAIMQKIDFFLKNKEWYIKKGIPYNLGILLYGDPGCGKTRFIKQLMNYTGRHGIDIKLSDTMDFNDLQNIIYKEEIDDLHIIPQDQRILIFEDIDALGDVVKERKQTGANGSSGTMPGEGAAGNAPSLIAPPELNEMKLISNLLQFTANTNTNAKNNNLSYLLNMLDGIHECSGRIIIITTNRPEVLDKALIRPGRIDLKIHFKKCTRYDISRMLQKFWELDIAEESIRADVDGKYTCAELINVFRSSDDFEQVRDLFVN